MSNQQTPLSDRNFNDLSERFQRTIYDTLRGSLRLAALRQDFSDLGINPAGKRVRDLGGGQGQFSLELAQQGASIELCDISSSMLAEARKSFSDASQPLDARCCPIQESSGHFEGPADIVMNHAVLEWLEQPFDVLPTICQQVASGGYLSLMFYNLHGHRWRQIMNGNPENPDEANPKLRTQGNAPHHPLDPDQVFVALQQQGLEILRWRGIRCIHDHMPQKVRLRVGDERLTAADLKYGLEEPYRQLGRYIHVVAQRP